MPVLVSISCKVVQLLQCPIMTSLPAEWYFVIRLASGSWLPFKQPYCGLDSEASSTEVTLVCNRKAVPHFSLFNFAVADEPVSRVWWATEN
jgi:hypothetical protein